MPAPLIWTPTDPATTIASGSNNAALPQATIHVASTTGFGSTGTLLITTAVGVQYVLYTGTSGGNAFTGCTGGVGTLLTGMAVSIPILEVADVLSTAGREYVFVPTIPKYVDENDVTSVTSALSATGTVTTGQSEI